MVKAAQRGLDLRKEHGRGGTAVGVARARDIVNRSELSISTVKRMYSFFSRHEVDKKAEGFNQGEKGYPSAGKIAWLLWGGDAGFSWSKKIRDRIERMDERDYQIEDERPYTKEHAARLKDPSEYQGFRRMNDEFGDGIHLILGLKGGEAEEQSLRFDKSKFSADEAREWLADHDYEVIKFEPAVEERAMERAEPNELSVGDFVEWNSSGGKAMGKIESIERDGEIDVPNADVTVSGTEEDPAALIRIYRDGEETDTLVAHKFSTLSKTSAREEEVETPESADRLQAIELEHRSMVIESSPINEEAREARIAVSSEEPVARSFGMEVLEHSEEAIDLSFLNSGRAPLLLDHDPTKVVGVVKSVELDSSARRLRATVRFGKGALAKEAFDDVVDGIRTNISVGYTINKLERKDKDTYVAKSWKPMEASLVSIPADTSVGLGRSADVTIEREPAVRVSPEPVIKTDFKNEETIMSEVDIAAVEAEAKKAAQRNAAQIVELGAKHNRSDLAHKAIAEGRSIEEFRGELLDVIGSSSALEKKEIGLTKKEQKRFSLFKVVNALANPSDRRAQEAAAFELEVGRAAAQAYGANPQGIMVPFEVLGKRDLNSADESDLFSDDFRGGEFVDVLRNASSVMQAGARMLSGLSGDVAIPKKASAASAAWISTEGGAASESEMTTTSITMVPRQLAAYTDITRQLRQQSSLDVENLVRDDLAQSLALAVDLAALAGTGSSGQPTGIKNTSGVNTTTFGAAAPTFAEIVAMETAVANDNALLGNLAYIMTAAGYGGLKTTEKASNTAQFVVEPGGSVNGYRSIVSNQVTAGDFYFGNFNDLLVGMWNQGVDITIDPYSLSTTGSIRIVAFSTVDVAVRNAVSFCVSNDGV
jgi:HK97 family phage major capsid protein/HK97 family phage prohead protease